ncbi:MULTISPECIES: TIGR03667 family PPOX class F420-dependent oxidoreductase [unclassified Nocardia]|uniref:TIGR03667 family PPOX class F420-dependent oxidoreductase n=1 Tax=unclassified Nocardia TaxID=2637762 RepID=UPI001CE3B5EE|nr:MULTISPECIES: TIGR03667 family PPOX class F420-dependent oxidoreductase [unclassified Nocardia]
MTATESDRSASVVDPNTEYGARVTERLARETVIWLTTVGASGTPQPNPVWFQWRDEEFLLFSEPNQAKLRNLTRNPRVALNLNTAASGNDVAVLTGTARIDPNGATPDEIEAFTTKYRKGMTSISLTPEQFYAKYSTVVRITPDRLRGF